MDFNLISSSALIGVGSHSSESHRARHLAGSMESLAIK